MIERKELQSILELVKPALSTKPLVPIFQSFCFTGESVYAYNDELGISAPCEIDINVALSGETLLGLLSNSRGKTVKISVNEDNNEVQIKTGSSNIKLPYFSSEDFIFEEPEDDWEVTLSINSEVIDAIGCCLTTASKDTTQRAYMGVSLENYEEDGLCFFYSCDGDSLTRYIVEPDDFVSKKDSQYIMPSEFCQALLRFMDKSGLNEAPALLKANSDWVKAEFETGHSIYGRIIQKEKPLDFEKLIKDSFDEESPFVAIPEGISFALKRALVVVDKDTMKTKLSIEGKTLRLITESANGIVKDVVKIDEHEELEVFVNAELMERSINLCEEIAITEMCTAYRVEDYLLQVVGNIEED